MHGGSCCLKKNVVKAPVVPKIHTQALGEREAAVPMRHFLKDRVVQMLAKLHSALRATARAYSALFTGECYQ
jgi:hypothetical protein